MFTKNPEDFNLENKGAFAPTLINFVSYFQFSDGAYSSYLMQAAIRSND